MGKEELHPKNGFETRAIHSGLGSRENTGAVIPPIFATSTFESGNKEGFDYTRSGNPNFRNLESTLASLEDARFAVAFSSGVAAITAVISTLNSGDLVLAEENLYGCTFRLFEQVFRKFGVEIKYIDFSEEKNFSLITSRKPQLVWIESPTNPLLKIIDIKTASEFCRKAGSVLLVDNTFASSFFQHPLTLGADLSLSSTTKYINGHSDCLGGVICTNSEHWREQLEFSVKALGLNPSPFDTWLIARGAKTLALRMKAHEQNALSVASYLENISNVRRVRYPFSSSHPQCNLAKKQMLGGSGIVTADLNLSENKTLKFLRSLKYFTLAESLGGVESLVCHPSTMTHGSVPLEIKRRLGITEGLVRFSVGIENVNDLIGDISQALEQISLR